jgi:dTDP-4-amino-4,6-dideoxygalactose transaminase
MITSETTAITWIGSLVTMISVPFVDFSRVPADVREAWKRASAEIIDDGLFIGGVHVAKFEQQWAETIGVEFAVGVGNGLDGLVIALKVLGVGEGDLVAVPSHTFIATWNAVRLVGATPIGIDVDDQGLMDLDQLESCTEKIKVVIPVHMHGMMVDMPRLQRWAVNKAVLVIEDASQAHLAVQDGKLAGNWSDIGVFSLYPSKNLGALGDAGVVTTNSAKHASTIRSYSNYGASINDKYLHESFGVNSRLDSIQASFLSVNLNYLSEWNGRRKSLAGIYLDKIQTNENLKFLNANKVDSVWHHFPVLVKNRSAIQEQLKKFGVQTEIHYPNLAAYEYQKISKKLRINYPQGERIADSILSLPISPWHTDQQILYVCQAVNRISKISFPNC